MEGKQTLPTEVFSVKIKFNEDIRRLSCPTTTTLEQLRTEVYAKYGLDSNSRFCLKYEDEEGDLITLGSEADLKEALQFLPATKFLRLSIVKGKLLGRPAEQASPVVTLAPAPITTIVSSAPVTATTGSVPTKDQFKQFKKECKHHRKEGEKYNDEQLKEMKRAVKEEHRRQKEATKAAKGPKIVARYVKDVGTPDETELASGTPFVKTWRFRNEGESAWPSNCQLVFVSKLNGDQMGAPASVPVPSAGVGQEIDISVPMLAPTAPGRYVGYWRLCSSEGKKFGQRVRALIQVTASSSSSDSSSTSSEEEPTVAPLLEQLKQMGFHDQDVNARVLKRHNGNLEATVACLTRKQQKKAEKAAKKQAEKAEKMLKKAAKHAEKAHKKEAKSATTTPRK